MAITYPYDILAGFPGWTTEFDLLYRQQQSRTAGGRTYVKDLGTPLWQAAYVSRSLSPNDLDAWRAKLKALEGGMKEFIGYPISRCYPIAYPNASWPGNVVGSVTVKGSMLTKDFSRKGVPVNTDGAMFVTRSGASTIFDIDGIMKTVAADNPRFAYDPIEMNYAWPSENFSGTGWSRANASLGVQKQEQGITLTKIIPDTVLTTHSLINSRLIYVAGGTSVACSFYLMSDELFGAFIRCADSSGFIGRGGFRLDNNTTSTEAGIVTTMVNLGGGLYRVSVVFQTRPGTTAANVQLQLRGSASDAPISFAGDGISGIFAGGGQFEISASSTPYKKTVTGPVAKSLGLLVEPERMNIIAGSVQPSGSNGSWTGTGINITLNSALAPDGTLRATIMKENTSTGNHQLLASIAGTWGGDRDFYNSVFVKKHPGSARKHAYVWCGSFANHAIRSQCVIDLETGVLSSGGGAGGAIGFDRVYAGDGWWRVFLKGRTIASPGAVQLVVSMNPDTTTANASYTGDGVSEMQVWGFQQEDGLFPTSYIPTTTAAVMRGAESVLIYSEGENDWTLNADPAIAPRHSTDSLSIAGYAGYIKGYEAKLTEPVKTLSGVSLSFIGENRDSVVLDGLPAGYDARVGDYLRILENRLHQIVAVDGVELSIRPHLWPGTLVGDAVTLVRPDCPMVIIPGSISTSADPFSGRGTVSFQAIESR